ncbi:hypothetical protein J6590_002347 [Homalodisca vitripennis]|nr:hypothetical protein J6590_002347 [Homalodisca vitripennis]
MALSTPVTYAEPTVLAHMLMLPLRTADCPEQPTVLVHMLMLPIRTADCPGSHVDVADKNSRLSWFTC